MRSTRFFVDWVAATLPFVSDSIAAAVVAVSDIIPHTHGKWTYTRPLFGYKEAARTIEGILLMVGSSDMGTHLELPGSALSALTKASLQTAEVIHSLVIQSATFSRLDLAIDVTDSGLNIQALYVAFERHEADTLARRPKLILSNGGGVTLYIGAPQSDAQLRIYNKEAERRNVGELPTERDWIRIELQLRREKANTAGHMISAIPQTDRVVRTLILGFCDWPGDKMWVKVTRGAIMGIGPSTRRRGNVRKWLLSACATALAREIYADPAFKRQFEQSVAAMLNVLEQQNKAVKLGNGPTPTDPTN